MSEGSDSKASLPPYKPLPQNDPPAYEPPQRVPTLMDNYQPAPPVQPGGVTTTTVVVQQPCSLQTPMLPKPNNYIAFSVFNMLCCCFFLGLGALVRGLNVDSHYHAGRYEEAKRASVQARNLNIAGVVFGLIAYVAIIVLNVVRVVGFQSE